MPKQTGTIRRGKGGKPSELQQRIAAGAMAVLSVSTPAAAATGNTQFATPETSVLVTAAPQPMSLLRTYQVPIFQDQHTKVLIVECSRQIGKSHTLGEWAACRLMLKLQDSRDWLIVLISNSKANGIELGGKVAASLRRTCEADEQLRTAEIALETPEVVDLQRDPELGPVNMVDPETGRTKLIPKLELDDFAQRIEVRIGNKRGRVLVLSASPRTARGFSGDLGLDEFAFHENARAMWDAAYPMLDSNPQFVCRICSTHNGMGSLFNQWIKRRTFPVYSISRSMAWRMGRGEPQAMEDFYRMWRNINPRSARQAEAWQAKHGLNPQPQDRLVIKSLSKTDEEGVPLELTPDQAEAEADDRASYRQNYENEPSEAGGAFLEHALISSCEDPLLAFGPDKQAWREDTLKRLAELKRLGGMFFIGQDFARSVDLSVASVLYKDSTGTLNQVARLEMRDVSTPDQERRMIALMNAIGEKVMKITMDISGNGLGLYEYLRERYHALVLGINFSQTVAIAPALYDGEKEQKARITEIMATGLKQRMQDGALRLMPDAEQREDLRKPVRVPTRTGVSIAAARTAADHADRFWSLALAVYGESLGNFGCFTVDTAKECLIGGNNVFGGMGNLDWGGDDSDRSRGGFWGVLVSRRFAAKTPRTCVKTPPHPRKRQELALTFDNRPSSAGIRTPIFRRAAQWLKSATARLCPHPWKGACAA